LHFVIHLLVHHDDASLVLDILPIAFLAVVYIDEPACFDVPLIRPCQLNTSKVFRRVCVIIAFVGPLAMSRTSIELHSFHEPAHPSAVYTKGGERRQSTVSTVYGEPIRTHAVDDEISITRADSVTAAHVTSKSGTLIIILSTTLVTGIGSMLNGLITVSLPQLSRDLEIPPGLQLW